ncbi:M48 family peptidase, partial [Burkholderia sp. Ac-20353]|nr:M48 family peptidase [Burkholderia sp. Ac-20353]
MRSDRLRRLARLGASLSIGAAVLGAGLARAGDTAAAVAPGSAPSTTPNPPAA